MTTRVLLIVLFLAFFCVRKTDAQHVPPDFNLVPETNGITLGKINGIAQDKYGYLWLVDTGSQRLVRFDGYRMKIFQHIPEDSTSLGGKELESIASDTSGNIWVSVHHSIDKFDPVSNRFTHYRFPSSKNDHSIVSVLLADRFGKIWIGTTTGLYQLDPATGNFVLYSNDPADPTTLSCNVVWALYEDRNGDLWIGTGWPFPGASNPVSPMGGGLNKFNRQAGTFTRYMPDSKNPTSLSNDKVGAIFEDSRGVFWVGTQGDGLHTMNRKNGTFERHTYDPLHPEKLSRPPIAKGDDWDHIRFIKEDRSGAIWIGTYHQGLTRYDSTSKKVTRYRAEKTRLNGFMDSTVWSGFNTRDGTLWISVEGRNLYRVDPLQSSFTDVRLNKTVWSFLEYPAGVLWTGFFGNGMGRIDLKSSSRKNFTHYPLSDESQPVTSIIPTDSGKLLVTSYGDIVRFDPHTGHYSPALYKNNKSGEAFGGMSILNSPDGKLYVAGIGFYAVDKKSGLVERYNPTPPDTSDIRSEILTTSVQDRFGNIWMGSYHQRGVSVLNVRKQEFTHYLDGLTVWSIYADNKGRIWVGTVSGLYWKKEEDSEFTPYFHDDSELRHAEVVSLVEDNQHIIWGSSRLGIFRINPEKGEFNIYGKKFGVTIQGGRRSHSLRASNGEVFVGSFEGFYSFFPKQVTNNTAPQIILTDFKIDGKSVLNEHTRPFPGPIEEVKEIRLEYNKNMFSIDFAAIHFIDPDNNKIQYKLDGFGDDWRNVSEEKTAYYFNVPPNEYIFRIKATSSYGIGSELAVKIIVLPPWWQTWWAYVLYVILGGTALFGFIRLRTRTLQLDKIQLEEKVTARTAELNTSLQHLKATQSQLIQSEKMASLGELTAGIAHEIQNPLNFVNNFSEVNKELLLEMKEEIENGNLDNVKALADDVIENQEKINHHGKRADAIVKGMLQHSRTSSGVKEPTDINALADEYLRLAYHGLRAKDKSFNANMKTDFDDTIGTINIIPQDIGRVVLNLITNAFYAVDEKKKNLPGGQTGYEPTVTVSTKQNRGLVEIKVKDNGNGIPQRVLDKIFQPFFTTKPAGQGTGLGLSLSYDIVKAHGGEIKVNTLSAEAAAQAGNENEGTEFTITLPA